MLYNISKIKLDQTKRFELNQITQRIYKQNLFLQSFSFFGTILVHERYINKIKQTVEIPFYLLLYKLIESPVFHLLPANQISIPIITIDKVSIKVRETISFIYPR